MVDVLNNSTIGNINSNLNNNNNNKYVENIEIINDRKINENIEIIENIDNIKININKGLNKIIDQSNSNNSKKHSFNSDISSGSFSSLNRRVNTLNINSGYNTSDSNKKVINFNSPEYLKVLSSRMG